MTELSGPSGPSVAFAANATYGEGGQGEFLRLMAHALAARGAATIYSRFTPPGRLPVVNLPLDGTARATAFHLLQHVPVANRRVDWLTLLADGDLDMRVAAAIDPPALFDGVTAQCCDTIRRLQGSGARIVVTCLNTHIDYLARTLREESARSGFTGRTFVHPRMRARALREIAAADHLRVNSPFAKQTFVDHGVDPDRISVIYPGVDVDHFRPSPKRDDTFRVLVVSSIDVRKGIRYVLEAFEQAQIPNAELVLIGGTGDRWSKQLVAGYMARNRNIVRRTVDIMAASADEVFGPASVLVHAAVEDGFGLVIPQALASGRPVIAARTAGASALVRHGETGFVVDARSVPQFVDALRTLAHDRELWTEMCARARPSVEALTYDRFATDVAAMYERVCS